MIKGTNTTARKRQCNDCEQISLQRRKNTDIENQMKRLVRLSMVTTKTMVQPDAERHDFIGAMVERMHSNTQL
jgi:hypothetical protein